MTIGEGSLVERSILGPNTSVGRDCRIVDSRIEDSIVLHGCSISDVRGLRGSILGKGVEVVHTGGSGMHRLMVGDQSRVEVD